MLNKDIMYIIMQEEKEYLNTVKNAVNEAERYGNDSKKKQSVYIEGLQQEWYLFEKAENEKFQKALIEDEQKMEAEIVKSKEWLKICQKKKADIISERLKEEVLSLYGNS